MVVDFMLVEDERVIELLAAAPKALGNTIRAERKRPPREWSQEALASRMRRLGHPSWRQTTVAKVEAGTRPVTLAEAVSLSFALGLPKLETLYGDLALGDLLVRNFVEREQADRTRAWQVAVETIRTSNPEAAGAMAAAMQKVDELVNSMTDLEQLERAETRDQVQRLVQETIKEYRDGVNREA